MRVETETHLLSVVCEYIELWSLPVEPSVVQLT